MVARPSRTLARRLASGLLARLARTADAIAERIEPQSPLRALISVVQPTGGFAPSRHTSGGDPPAGPPPIHRHTHRTPPARPTPGRSRSSSAVASSAAVVTATAVTTATIATDAVRLATHLGQRIQPSLDTLKAAASWTAEATPSAEKLRQLRVASRRLRAFVRLFAPLIGAKRARRLNRRLRKITRALGPIRERTASAELLQRAIELARTDLDHAALEHLVVETRHDDGVLLTKAMRQIQGVDPAKLARELKTDLDKVCGGIVLAGSDVRAHVWPSVSQRLDSLFAEMPPRDPSGDIEALHELRIRAKRVRYTLELLRPLLGEYDRQTRRVAKKVQRTLGEFRDAALLHTLAHDRSQALGSSGQHVLAQALARQAKMMAASRDKAIEDAQGWLASFDPTHLRQRLARAFGVPARVRTRTPRALRG